MKILLYADPHFSQYSSIIRKNEVRLDNQLQTFAWIEAVANNYDCESIVCCGDFFDSCDLNAYELTALSQLTPYYSEREHFYIVGNHEIKSNDNSISSTSIMSLIGNSYVHGVPTTQKIPNENVSIFYLPYQLHLKDDITEYFIDWNTHKGRKRILITHNDIKGLQMGAWKSTTGLDIQQLTDNFDLVINGHIHNHIKVTDKIINLGNITGQNFSEDATKYLHCAMILDTNTLQYELIENPFAFNFYKFDFFNSSKSQIKQELSCLKENAVVCVKCDEQQERYIKQCLRNAIAYKIIIDTITKVETAENIVEDLHLDHIKSFNQFIHNNLQDNQVIDSELEVILK